MKRLRSSPIIRPSLCAILFWIFFGVLWIAGGASRADVLGQVVVRGAATIALILVMLFGERRTFVSGGPVLYFLIAALSLTLLQLVPLPPSIWQALPGRAILTTAAIVSDQVQPWRPLSIVPGTTANAAASLIVPITTLVLLSGLKQSEKRGLPSFILGLIVAAMVTGMIQFSGAGFDNPFVNDGVGLVSGPFANYSHYALFLAIGCLLAPVWAFLDSRPLDWRGLVAIGLVALFTLTLLASGSRAGLGLGGLALGIGFLLVRRPLGQALRHFPRWAAPVTIASIVGLVAVLVLISVASDRAVSIDRAISVDPWQDLRRRALPTMLSMAHDYFPVGAGFGTFDPIFRIHEPYTLLSSIYFNHAHNDLLEIVLDAGLPGLLLLIVALAWWGLASLRAWRAGPSLRNTLPKLGSAILLLVLVASAFDYPARTPLIMALVVVAAVWLSESEKSLASALPGPDQHL